MVCDFFHICSVNNFSNPLRLTSTEREPRKCFFPIRFVLVKVPVHMLTAQNTSLRFDRWAPNQMRVADEFIYNENLISVRFRYVEGKD